jgi:hypothetical protein
MQMALVFLYTLDFLIFIVGGGIVRFSRPLRPAILLGRHRDLRRIFFIITTMLPRLGRLFSLLFAFILTFAVIGVYAFAGAYNQGVGEPELQASSSYSGDVHVRQSGHVRFSTAFRSSPHASRALLTFRTAQGAFDNPGTAFLRLFVLFTTENYPMITLPAWSDAKGSSSFFFIFVYVGIVFLDSLLLALVSGKIMLE